MSPRHLSSAGGPTGLLLVMLASALVCGAASAARAHDLGVVRVEIRQTEPTRYLVTAKLPPTVAPGMPSVPARCVVAGPPSVTTRSATTALARWTLGCGAPPLGPGDVLSWPWRRDGVFVTIEAIGREPIGRFIEAGEAGVDVRLDVLAGHRSRSETFARYLKLGVEHILLGWDHLAFVLALCLIASGWQLAKLVTAFTVGHSLTLAAAVLGVARLPAAPVEACIALSIAFVAREALLGTRGAHRGSGLVVAFGLLHGLGFASALVEVGVPPGELLLGLLAFNVGVEAGQLAFVLGVAVVAQLCRSWRGSAVARPAIAYGLGALGFYWTIERVQSFVPF